MPRDEFDDDYRPRAADDEGRRVGRKRNRTRTALIVAGVVLAFVVAVVAIWRAVLVKIWDEDRQVRAEQHRQYLAQVNDDYERRNAEFARTEFEQAVLGKTPAEVCELFTPVSPPPDLTSASVLAIPWGPLDPTSGRAESEVRVEFEGGKAVRVIWP